MSSYPYVLISPFLILCIGWCTARKEHTYRGFECIHDIRMLAYIPRAHRFDIRMLAYIPRAHRFDIRMLAYIPRAHRFDIRMLAYIPRAHRFATALVLNSVEESSVPEANTLPDGLVLQVTIEKVFEVWTLRLSDCKQKNKYTRSVYTFNGDAGRCKELVFNPLIQGKFSGGCFTNSDGPSDQWWTILLWSNNMVQWSVAWTDCPPPGRMVSRC